jgi:ribosome modulation factor
MTEIIYYEGYDAYHAKNDIDTCPYGGRLATIWMNGWRDAEQEDYDNSL